MNTFICCLDLNMQRMALIAMWALSMAVLVPMVFPIGSMANPAHRGESDLVAINDNRPSVLTPEQFIRYLEQLRDTQMLRGRTRFASVQSFKL